MRSWWTAVFGVWLAGCGAESAREAPGISQGSGGHSASASGDAGGSGGADEATIAMDRFTVEPGGEVFLCQTFANPFGESVYIGEFETHMSTGSHHLIVNYYEGIPPSLDLEPCSGLTAPTGPFATQTPDDKYTYPAGIAVPLEAESNLRLISHYVNTASTTLSPTVTLTMRRARARTVVQRALTSSWNYYDFEIPPHSSLTVDAYGGFVEDTEILWLVPHMHSRGKHFKVTMGETNPSTVYETNEWEVPPRHFDPPLLLRAQERLSYTCTWTNDTNETLTFGESAVTNEMCLLALHYTAPLATE